MEQVGCEDQAAAEKYSGKYGSIDLASFFMVSKVWSSTVIVRFKTR